MKIRNSSFSLKFVFFTIFAVLLLNSSNFGRELKLLKEKSFTVKKGQKLDVKSDVGDIIIKTWDQEIVEVNIYGDNDAKRKMEFSFDQDENGVKVIGEKEGGKLFGWFSSVELKYEIKVPSAFNLDLKTSGGDLMVKEITGEFVLKTSGGDIYTKNMAGNLKAGTSGGDITLYELVGDAEVSTSGGDIEARTKGGKMIANTSGGDISLKSSDGEVYAKTSGGDIVLDYSGENYGINLFTSGGDIDVKLPSQLNADVEIKTSGGDLQSNFAQNRMTKVSKSQLIGKFNSGGNSLVCKTSGGDITVVEK